MYYDQNGRPDPDGDCEMKDGKLILRNGRHLRFSLAHMRDGAPTGHAVYLQDITTSFSDTERTFADSDAGREAIARAKSAHDLNAGREGFRPFSDADALAAIRAVSGTGHSIIDQNALDQASAASDAAYARSAADLNAWRNS